MLKITSRNEKLNRRMVRKETLHFLHKIFHCFFVFRHKPSFLKSLTLPSRQKRDSSFFKNKRFYFFQRFIFLSQFQRYCINWQSKLLLHSSFTKTRTICFLTGRSRSVYRAFRLSRLKIRAYAAAGYFIGLSKASW